MRIIWAIVTFFLLLHIIMACKLGMSVDGAHYALYGEHLALSYYDHPPLVGWLQALALPLGHTDGIMRFWPFLCSTGTMFSLYYIAPRMLTKISPYFGGYCMLMYCLSIILNLLGIDLIPQTLLLFFGLWTTYSFYLVTQAPNLIRWMRLGIFLGLSGLSEYTAVLLVPGIFFYFLLFDRSALKSIKLYLSLFIALLCISPILIWNAENSWISIQFQLHHGLPTSWNWSSFFISLLLQFLCYGLVPFVFGWLGIISVLRKRWSDTGSRILTCLALPILIMFTYSGGHQRILPHWPSLGWLLTIPLAIRYMIEHWQKFSVRLFLYFSITIISITYLFAYTQILFSWAPFSTAKSPFNDLYGWKVAAKHSKALLQQFHLSDTDKSVHLFAPLWSASRLSWYTDLPVIVPSFGSSQFQLWYGNPNATSNGILVVPGDNKQPADFTNAHEQFQHCAYIDTISTVIRGKIFNQFTFYHCWHFNA